MAAWPQLPVALYFLRDGRLWRWPAKGGNLELLPFVETYDNEQILDFRLTPDGHQVVYMTSFGRLHVLDRRTGEQVSIPITGETSTLFAEGKPLAPGGSSVPGDVFDLTPDGRYVVYLGWGAESSDSRLGPGLAAPPLTQGEERARGAILAAEVSNPDRQYVLGFCESQELKISDLETIEVGCQGFALSPDGHRVVFADGRGVWAAHVPEGPPRLLAEHQASGEVSGFHYSVPAAWSPDGHWLIVNVVPYEGIALYLMNADTGRTLRLPRAGCFIVCPFEAVWGTAGVWVASGDIDVRGEPVVLYSAQVSGADTLEITRWITATEMGAIPPTSLHALPDGRLGFALQKCAGRPGPEQGIYVWDLDNTVRQVSPLPAYACSPYHGDLFWGSVAWAPGGTAFLYLDEGEHPVLLGLTDGSALWDVRELLQGGHRFRWGHPEP